MLKSYAKFDPYLGQSLEGEIKSTLLKCHDSIIEKPAQKGMQNPCLVRLKSLLLKARYQSTQSRKFSND